ncbi:hypothetical protein [Roseomonas sp. 18066]|nr:hypothetical protein [Roseomonas sp. 18066]
MSDDDKKTPEQQGDQKPETKPVDEQAQADAAKEREKTGGYQ